MKLSHRQRIKQAVIFWSTCDEAIEEVAQLFRVNAKALQREYNNSYVGRYSY